MKIICKQEKLIKALNIVSKAVSPTSTLGITKGILIKTEGDMKISLSATDIQISITTAVDAIVNEKGGVVVSARLFTDLVRKLPAGDILITADEENIVVVKTEYSEYKLQGKVEEEFPRMESDESGRQLRIEKEEIRDLINGTAFAASTDESRGVITGVLFELKEDKLSLVALDGFRVAIKREKSEAYKGESVKAIIPARLVREISKVIADTEGENEALLDIGERRIKVFVEETLIRVNLLEGEYIKYNDVLPKENKIKLVVGRNELLGGVERAAMLRSEGKNPFVRFSVEEGMLTVSSRADEGRGHEKIKAQKTGEDLEIGFDARFLTDVLKAISDDEIQMQFNTSVSPCLISPVEGDRYEYLILPVRLSTVSV
ncbi:MAG: DNA polymerase III subunit beta [Clostridiales bacterium]|nr:DNA polymerase III subunit beta [Clostridiales bacterium]